MFYDLNIPWSPTDPSLPRTLSFAHELGYTIVALNHTISGKLPPTIENPIPIPSAYSLPPTLKVLRRCTLTLTDTHQNARLQTLSQAYDILALRPIDERTLQLACSTLSCSIISLDLTQRLPFFFKYKTLSEAIRSGKKIEICYSQGLMGDAQARRNLISNATQLIRASRGRGLLLSSESKVGAVGLRGPWDVVNLAAVWGLGQEKGYEGVSKEARTVVVSAALKSTGYRGAVDVVYGGEKPPEKEKKDVAVGKQKQKQEQGQKRKAGAIEGATGADDEEKPISKREAKRRAHHARMQGSSEGQTGASSSQGNAANPSSSRPSDAVTSSQHG